MSVAKRRFPDRATDRLHADLGESQARTDRAIAASTGYTPAVVADWSGNPPSTLAEALDRIAAALGPIS